ncbi:BMP family ABC transporter substrate-binding protein [Alkalihalobacillus sp. MEB130]|uniref:BMP family ABC transporter substrate-binding protein n=1 Tax=Alkalihalobacillus sp. MEB130 TaxID=2976704 RepID=UPI0028DF3A5E|nr:BMP family ABC transporter substrate-binding protein [Alkalihalobacillus sp. MEB130]MDT8859623.1 BMP family ABC transporter substrate-binding protein [Alkalihalobacillus sp. MEB130]
MIFQRLLLLLLPILLIGCSSISSHSSSENKVGLLLEDTIDDQGWNSKGYQGLLNIHSNLNIDVVFMENMNTESKVKKAIEDFDEQNVNLVFGHGRFYADLFTQLGTEYSHIHFVSFNGEVEGENVTSLHFNSYAMGYFAGMLAAAMSENGNIGAIAAFDWQPEIKGFQDGASLSNSATIVHLKFVEDWADRERALTFFDELKQEGVDVFYPAGDGYHIDLIEEIRKEGLYAIGFVSDQSDLGETTILTSTVQHVDYLYELVAKRYYMDELHSGNLHYDFQDEVISLGEFSSSIPEEIKRKLEEAVQNYIKTGELPTEPIL